MEWTDMLNPLTPVVGIYDTLSSIANHVIPDVQESGHHVAGDRDRDAHGVRGQHLGATTYETQGGMPSGARVEIDGVGSVRGDGNNRLDGPNVRIAAGAYEDEDGNDTIGGTIHGGILEGSAERIPGRVLEGGFATGGMSATANRSTAEIGADLNILGASLGQDEGTRVGGSLGIGARGRLHYGQGENIGFGADIGPASFDLRPDVRGAHRAINRGIRGAANSAAELFTGLFD